MCMNNCRFLRNGGLVEKRTLESFSEVNFSAIQVILQNAHSFVHWLQQIKRNLPRIQLISSAVWKISRGGELLRIGKQMAGE